MSEQPPLILLTNDDGLASPGLLAVLNAVAPLGELLVAAPARQQSGMGRSTPMVDAQQRVQQSVLRVDGREVPGYAVPGSPAQAVVYAVLVLAARRPSLVISGINYGENVGNQITASGTVGAALEAAGMGIPALAVSLETEKAYHYHHGVDVHWEVAAAITRHFAQQALHGKLPADVDVLNINVPANATAETPWHMTRLSRCLYYETYARRPQPRPELSDLDYRVAEQVDVEPGSDIDVFARQRRISVTPLSLDLTARVPLPELERWLRNGATG